MTTTEQRPDTEQATEKTPFEILLDAGKEHGYKLDWLRKGESFGQNSGLGLSISRQIAEAHGGTLRAENVMDPATGRITGARFMLSLPVETAT